MTIAGCKTIHIVMEMIMMMLEDATVNKIVASLQVISNHFILQLNIECLLNYLLFFFLKK